MDVKTRSLLRSFVSQRLRMHGDPAPVGDDEPLFTSGRLDSLDAVELVMTLEADYGMDFSKLSFDLTRLDSIAAIGALVERDAIKA